MRSNLWSDPSDGTVCALVTTKASPLIANQRTDFIEKLLRAHHARILAFEADPNDGCLEIR